MLDVSDASGVARAIAQLISELGHIDVLCNNAGVNSAGGNAADVSPGDFAAVFNVNVLGLYACTHAVLPHMIERDYGRVVNVSSGSAFTCLAGSAAYSASKAAVNAMTIGISRELEDANVLVNAMSPRAVRTDMNPTAETMPSESVPTAVRLASLPEGGLTGRFFRFEQELPMVPNADIDFQSGPR